MLSNVFKKPIPILEFLAQQELTHKVVVQV